MVLCKRLLRTIGKLLNGGGVVVYCLFQDQVALQHQHGTLLILEDERKQEDGEEKYRRRAHPSKQNKLLQN